MSIFAPPVPGKIPEPALLMFSRADVEKYADDRAKSALLQREKEIEMLSAIAVHLGLFFPRVYGDEVD